MIQDKVTRAFCSYVEGALKNQKLVESLAQIILSLSDEERQLLERRVQKSSISLQIADLENRLKTFEAKYQMPSDHFHQRFQSGELGDSIDFF